MKAKATFYDEGSGVFGLCMTFSSQEAFEINTSGKSYVEGHYNADKFYVLAGQPTERPSSPVTLSDLTLMDVPAGSTLWINAERYENVEGNIELEFPLPGTYRLRVECWPYRDWEGEVTA